MSVIDYPPEDATRDIVLEWVARLVEAGSITDWSGLGARRKRDREAAEKRRQISQEVRAQCADQIRAFIGRSELGIDAILAEVAALSPDTNHARMLVDAWPLAWKGLVEIECSIKCNSNQLPPATRYRITLTDKGRAMIAAAPDGGPA
jgi:hypothetical protein